MDNIQINKFAKKIIEENALPSLLSSLVDEINKQNDHACFLESATYVTEKDALRYMFLTIPDDKESDAIESKVISIILG